jgi:hypothetical protein
VRYSERGESLLEVIVAVAIVSGVVAAVLGGVVAATHRFGPDPIHEALVQRTQSELRIAMDALKYQGATLSPTTVATTVPLAGGSPLPAHETLATSTSADGSLVITINASADGRSDESASSSVSLANPAPLPSASIPAANNGSSPI